MHPDDNAPVLVASSLPLTRAALVTILGVRPRVEASDADGVGRSAASAGAIVCTTDLAEACLRRRRPGTPVVLVHFEPLPRPVLLPGGVCCISVQTAETTLERVLGDALGPGPARNPRDADAVPRHAPSVATVGDRMAGRQLPALAALVALVDRGCRRAAPAGDTHGGRAATVVA